MNELFWNNFIQFIFQTEEILMLNFSLKPRTDSYESDLEFN